MPFRHGHLDAGHADRWRTLEQDEVGGTVAKYPRQKLVMTSPVEFPMYGKSNKRELSKEALLNFWWKVVSRSDLRIQSGEKVNDIRKGEDGLFTVDPAKGAYRARAVTLALGRTGTPAGWACLERICLK